MTDSVPYPQDIQDVLRTIELYEDDAVCDSEVIVVETGLERSTVDTVLDQLWREDRIECRAFGWGGYPPLMTGIRRVMPDRDRRWGEHGRYREH